MQLGHLVAIIRRERRIDARYVAHIEERIEEQRVIGAAEDVHTGVVCRFSNAQ